MKTFYKRLITFVGSRRFFYLVLAVFVVEAAWVALSGLYPMAFDEDFHLGIIQIYAHHLSPILTKQPPNTGAFRSLVHDPSYLYHYLMSFPYRFVGLFTSSLYIKVIVLRLIDVALMASGLVVFRKVLQKTKARPLFINLAILFFVLTPVVPFLAGQINYDNLFIPLVGLSLLMTINLVEKLKAGREVSFGLVVGMAVLCLLTSLVKYAFLPIFLGIVIYLAYVLWKLSKNGKLKIFGLLMGVWSSAKMWKRVVGVVFIAMSLFMFTQRYGVNLVKYHNVHPRCDQVLSIKECSQNGPWERDFNLEKSKGHVDANPLRFTGGWIYGLFERSFFTVNGPDSGYSSAQFLPLLGVTAAAVGILGALFFIYYRKAIMGETKFLGFLLFVAALYSFVLYLDNYAGFLKTGEMVAINGRYLFPVFIPVYLAMALGWGKFLQDRARLKFILPAAVFIIFVTQGGGALTFILRSNKSWYWHNDPVVVTANRYVRDALNPIVWH